MLYRTDINGLRALAVLSVVTYHFFPKFIPSGFAGVDVFFVISGYLMTGIIYSKMKNDSFSFLNFYYSRAKRIFPPLLFLCLFLFIFGVIFLSVKDFKVLSKHLFTSLSFLSNIAYQFESGYFDSSSMDKWLLHTWSLSIEWQFYFLYPIVLYVLIKRFGILNAKKSLFAFTFIITLLSLFFSIKNPSFSYFSLLSRAPEMLFGGCAYFLNFQSFRYKKIVLRLSILMLVLSFFIFKGFSWPGFYVYVPIIFTVLIICFHTYYLDNKIFQFLGRISYSVYLWHWPIVVGLYKLGFFDSFLITLCAMIFSLIIGCFSFYLIEENIFNISLNNFKFLAFLYLILFSFSIFTYINPFYKGTFVKSSITEGKASPYRKSCHSSANNIIKPESSCELPSHNANNRWATFGDSHTVELAYSLSKELKKDNESLKEFSFSDCMPSYNLSSIKSSCYKWTNDSVNYIINDSNIKNVVVGFRYSYHFLDKGFNNNEMLDIWNSLKELIFTFSTYKDRVFVILPTPEIKKDINSMIFYSNLFSVNVDAGFKLPITEYNKRNKFILSHFKEIAWPENVVFINPLDSLCDYNYCYPFLNGKALYFDDNHLSVEGTKFIANKIINN